MYALHQPEADSPLYLRPYHETTKLSVKDRKNAQHLLEQLEIPQVFRDISGSFSEDIIAEIRSEAKSVQKCPSKNCRPTDGNDDDESEFLLCVYCRRWFHLGTCVPASARSTVFYLCEDCECERIKIQSE